MEKQLEELRENRIKKISSLDFFVLIILLIIIFDLEIFGIYGETFFRDFSIIFEGGYRITQFQIPYQDFFIPMGPVVFYMQAFFNSILGTNLFSMAMHAFVLAAILSVFFYFILRREFNYFMSFIFTIFLFLSFNGFTFYPFYNTTPYFFFFLNIFLLFAHRKKDSLPKSLLFLTAVLVTLSFYSKQDTGLLHPIFILFYFSFNYKKQWKSIFLYYILPLLIFIIGTYLLLSNITGFAYWFNLGQSPHNSRFLNLFSARSIWGIVTSWKFYITLFLFFAYLYYIFTKKKNDYSIDILFKTNNSRRLVTIFLIIAAITLISQSTSGLTNNSFSMGDPVLIFILFILIKENTDFLKYQKKIIIVYFLIVILLLSINPFAVYGQVLLNYKNEDLGRVSSGCYSGILMPKASLEGLNIIKNTIEKYGKPDFFSMTEYSFLYCDYNISPPKGIPLWFDEDVSFFKENIPDIMNSIDSLSPKVILVQDAHRKGTRNMAAEFEEKFISSGYTRTAIVDAPASYQKTYYSLGYTKTDIVKIEKTTAPIIILVRNDLLNN